MGQLAMAILRKPPSKPPRDTPQDMLELTLKLLQKEQTSRLTSAELLTSSWIQDWITQVDEAEMSPPRPADPTADPADRRRGRPRRAGIQGCHGWDAGAERG